MNSDATQPSHHLLNGAEIQVVHILSELPALIASSDRRSRFPPVWGAKRRRSAIDFPPSPPRASSSHPPPSLNPPAVCSVAERGTVKVEASSPATPLSFSPSESDAKSKHSKRKLWKKRRKEEWTDIIVDLTAKNEILKREIETVRIHYNNLKAFNLKCKERKRELSLKREESNLNPGRSMDLVKKETEFAVTCPTSQEEQQRQQQLPIRIVHQAPLFIDQTMHLSKILENGQHPNGRRSPNSSGLELNTGMSPNPLGIPDLNYYVKESIGMTEYFQAFALNKAVAAAEARRRRIEINRFKNAAKPRCR